MSGQVIAELLIEIGVEVPDAEKASEKIEKVKDSAQKLKEEGGSFVQGFTSEFSKMFVITAGDLANFAKSVPHALIAAAKQIFAFVDQTTEAVAKISHDAKASGLGTDEFQRLGQVAEKSGASSEVLGKSVRKLNAQMLEAAAGGGQGFVDALGSLGLNLEDLKGKSATDQLGLIGDALNGVTDKAKRSALSAKLFGEEGGPQLATMLSKGSDGINALAADAEGMISPETIAKSQAFQLQMKEFDNVLMSVKATIANALAPTIQAIIRIFQDWIEANEEWIEIGLPIIIDQLTASFEALYGFVAQSTEAFWQLADVTTLLNMQVASSIPHWDAIAKALLTVRNPIKDVADVIRILLDQLERLIIKYPAIKALSDWATSRSGGRNESKQAKYEGERKRQREVNQAGQASQAKSEEHAAKAVRTTLQNQAKDIVANTTTPGEKLSTAEKLYLRGSGVSESDIISIERKNISKKTGGGKGGKKEEKKEERKKKPVEETRTLLGQVLSGLGSKYTDQLPGLKRMQTGKEAYRPEVVMTINNYDFKVSQTIMGLADPVEIGKQAAIAVKQEFKMRLSKAGAASQVNVER